MIVQWIEWFPDLLEGLGVSVLVALFSILIGLVLGVMIALASISQRRIIRWPAIAVVEILRGVPLLVLIYLVYFGLPSVNITLEALVAAIAAIGLNTSAYMAEIVRGGLHSIPVGQYEASACLGMSRWQELRVVILPQTLRTVFSPLVSYSIIVFQATSLCYLIGVQELLSRAFAIGSITFEYLSVLMLVGIVYAVISIAGSRIAHGFDSGAAAGGARHRVRI